jgi:ABC-type branched-subunit amino acid transport system ATPase component
MIGNSKIVMLDEPSSGMDTTSRRKLWDMLKKNK